MKGAQNKMNNSSYGSNRGESVRSNSVRSATDSTKFEGDLRELRNQGDVRDVTEKSGNKRINITDS
jgi:hypothetical protein